MRSASMTRLPVRMPTMVMGRLVVDFAELSRQTFDADANLVLGKKLLHEENQELNRR